MAFLFLFLLSFDLPRIQVIDLDGGEPRHLVVVIDGEPYKVVSIPAGSGPAPGPTPAPVPPPAPTPTPTPDQTITGMLWVTYVVPDAPSVDDVAPTSHAPLRARIDGKNISWRMQNASDAELTRRRFEEHAKNAPIAVFQDEKGKILELLKSNDPAAILGTIEKYKGKK